MFSPYDTSDGPCGRLIITLTVVTSDLAEATTATSAPFKMRPEATAMARPEPPANAAPAANETVFAFETMATPLIWYQPNLVLASTTAMATATGRGLSSSVV